MTETKFTMRELMEAGVHFGHHKRRWNPKMAPYIFGVRNAIHIINLDYTKPMLQKALECVEDVVSNGGRVLFVATKRQAQEIVADAAKKCGQYYVNHRWLGGMLTNWQTVSNSIATLKKMDEQLANEAEGLTKKEILNLTRERDKLERVLGGIRDMGGVPDLIFVIDTNKESIAIQEARKLGIPVIAVADTNSDPDNIDYLIPGNDDASRAIQLYCDLVARAVLKGIEKEMSKAGKDLGEIAKPEMVEASLRAELEVETLKAEDGGSKEAKVNEVVVEKKSAPKKVATEKV